jgi:hypothetical protein
MGSVLNRFKGNKQNDQSMMQQEQPVQYGPQTAQFAPGAPQTQQQQQLTQYGAVVPPMQQQQQQQQRQYGPGVPQMQQQGPPIRQIPPGYAASYSNGPSVPYYSGRPPMPSSYEDDMHISSVFGIPPSDVGRLRAEFYNYTNPYGEIDREGFEKLYVASLLNKTWNTIQNEAATIFRTFDFNHTGGLDFNEYMAVCARMTGPNPQLSMYSY